MKPLLPNNKPSIDGNTVRLIEDGNVVTDPSITFNNYFTSPIIKEPILNLSEDDFENRTSVVTIRNQSFNLDFSFEQINSRHIADLLLNLNVKKSAGPDGLSPKLLKISAPVIAAPVAKLFNFCINAGTWPPEWKLSDVTPAFKKGEVTSKKNYRLISVLSTIPELFEKVKFDQLYERLSPIFSDNMSGFLRGHSCATALIKLTDDWRMALDQKKEVGTVAIDLSKAFDSICHNLLAKLRAYGLRDSALKLMRSYLEGRKQRVKCNGVFSDWLPLRCGVPQGNLLGPLLFNIFMNDVNKSVNNSSLRIYADDTTQYADDFCPAVLQYTLNQDIQVLSDWFIANFLQLNGPKTHASNDFREIQL